MALGQQWYVKGVGFYRLTNWANRKTSSGWTKLVDPNNIDTTLFQIVSALPTSGINKNRIYLVASANRDPNGKNIYAEYIYTGDTSATYDATKWEKIGEYTPTVNLSPYMKLEQKGVANGVATLDANGKVTDGQLWDATSENHGLISAFLAILESIIHLKGFNVYDFVFYILTILCFTEIDVFFHEVDVVLQIAVEYSTVFKSQHSLRPYDFGFLGVCRYRKREYHKEDDKK